MTARQEPSPGLGKRLREERQRRGLSMRELAHRVGCSPSLISQVERGVCAPSAGMVYLMATELQTSLDSLFGVEPARPASGALSPHLLEVALAGTGGAGEVVVTRGDPDGSDDRDAHAPREHGGHSDGVVQPAASRAHIELSSGVRWERLTPRSEPYVDFLEVIYQPHAHSHGSRRALRHDGREYGLVLSGRLRVEVGFETYELAAGDSVAFDSSTPHAYWNPTDEMVHTITLIVHREPWRA